MAAVQLTRRADHLAEGAFLPQRLELDRPPAGQRQRDDDQELIPSTRRAAPIGVRAAMLISVETSAIAPQKTEVTVGPAIALPGSTALDSRRLSWVTSGLEPLRLRVRAGRAVVEARLPLAPAALVRQPLISRAGPRIRGHERRPRDDTAQRVAGVVTADAGPAAPVLDVDRLAVEGRVRARGRVDDRMRAVLLHLLVVPAGLLAPAMLEQPHLRRALLERLRRGRRVEDQLHPLPVGLVQVVELVEVVEEPVLDHEPPGRRPATDVGVGERRGFSRRPEVGEVARVGAARLQRVPGEIEVVAPVQPGDVSGGRGLDLALAAAGGRHEDHARVAEHRVHGRRLVLLAIVVARRVVLLAEHRDRRVGAHELALRGRGRRPVGTGARADDREHDHRDRSPEPDHSRDASGVSSSCG